MRVVLCDEDELLLTMVEAIVVRQGHDVVGMADTTPAAVGLIEHAKPDIAIIDLALGFNTDFDAVKSAINVGARVIVFSHTADAHLLEAYSVRPIVVPKPNLDELERVLITLPAADEPATSSVDRRVRPTRAASGPPPTGPGDAQAFYESLNSADGGDGIVWADLSGVAPGIDEHGVVEQVKAVMRAGDRLLASPGSIRVFLPGADEDGVASFRRRLGGADVLPAGSAVHSVVVADGESPTAAFDRLKTAPAS